MKKDLLDLFVLTTAKNEKIPISLYNPSNIYQIPKFL